VLGRDQFRDCMLRPGRQDMWEVGERVIRLINSESQSRSLRVRQRPSQILGRFVS
jgi:hypothetical protein